MVAMRDASKFLFMSGFFEELQRRRVYRVAAAYIIAAGFIIQMGSAILPAWELPNWTFRLVVVLLLIGFPIALMLAWAFDVTPEGIRATEKTTAETHLRRNMIILVAAGVIVSAVAGFFLLPRASGRNIDKSIAVLPFENLSGDPDNAYFADGIQDDILTNLSKIGDLKVISRTSVMSYRGSGTRNARDIGKALGVATLVEGSVRRIGNRVRVNVQLINASNDEHIWAEDYDRDLTDVFAIQTDLAQQIVRELQAKLSPMEKAQIEKKPTENGEAYLAFMQGHEMFYRADKFRSNTEKAEQLFEKATKLDPNFAGAFTALAWVHDWNYHDFDPTPARKEKARAAAVEALRLQPNLPEAHLAMGFYYYYCERDYQAALDEFAIAKLSLPNSPEVYMAIGAIERRQGKWKESTANLQKAASLSPKDAWVLQNLADNYYATRSFEAADKIFDRAIEAAPGSFGARAQKANLAIDWKGDLGEMERQLAQVPTGFDPDG